MQAAENNAHDCMACLLEYGADPNKLSRFGWSPLMYASTYGSKPCVSLLLNAGADPHIKKGNRETAYDLTKDEDIKKILTEYV